MKKTLAILAVCIAAGSAVMAEESVFVQWDDGEGTVSNQRMTLGQLNHDIDVQNSSMPVGENAQSVYFEDCTLDFVASEFKSGGGNIDPKDAFSAVNAFEFVGDCTLNFEAVVTVTEPGTGFSLGPLLEGDLNALTINVGKSVATSNAWIGHREEGSQFYSFDLFVSSYFYTDTYFMTGKPRGNISLTIGGLGKGATIGSYKNAGYITSLDELGDGEIGLINVDYSTEGWEDDDAPWDGYKLMLVARSAAAPVITEDDLAPEPTTGTLSLLALAGLCARRRRK